MVSIAYRDTNNIRHAFNDKMPCPEEEVELVEQKVGL
jgi:hypothetical protein